MLREAQNPKETHIQSSHPNLPVIKLNHLEQGIFNSQLSCLLHVSFSGSKHWDGVVDINS